MGKPGKKAGKGLLPPTNPKRQVDDSKSHLRDQRTVKRLKMYSSKVKRTKDGHIVEGSVLSASDRVEKSMARIAPDRRWFGNTRVIGQEALQQFRTEMKARYNDPYSIIVKQGKLPLSLLDEGKSAKAEVPKNQLDWERTFGDKAQRKRVRLSTGSLQELNEMAQKDRGEYKIEKDRAISRDAAAEMFRGDNVDGSYNRSLYKKGQSNRIWNELHKVIDSSDVVLYVLDARDPLGTRSSFIEHFMKTEKKFKHFVFVLNKCDLIPAWATARWLQILSKDFPTIAFHASVEHPFGKGNLISLLRQFSRLHNVAHRGSKRSKSAISVGVIGYPNAGKSSVINTLRRKQVCKVAPIPGETKVWQYVALTRSIFLIDCPGIVYDREGNNDVQAVLKGVVRVERLGAADKTDVVKTVLDIVKPNDISSTYGIESWTDVEDFLFQLATRRGKLLPGGVPDTETVARSVLYDWQRGKIPWFNAPPFESNQQYRDALEKAESVHLKEIEHYSTFNIIDDRIVVAEPGAEEQKGATQGADQDEDDSEVDDDFDAETEFKKQRGLLLTSAIHEQDDDEEEEGEEEKPPKKKQRQEEATGRHSQAKKQGAGTPSAAQQSQRKGKQSEGKQSAAAPAPATSTAEEDALWAKFLAAS